MSPGFAARTALAVALSPRLWAVAAGQARRLSGRGWWRRPPFLPLPDADYERFRLTTQYGSCDHQPSVADVLIWLEWCRGLRRELRRESEDVGAVATTGPPGEPN